MEEKTHTTVDPEEIERFSRIAGEWWDEQGKFKPLHRINPLRIEWILEQVSAIGFQVSEGQPPETRNLKPLSGLTLLDIGCGGGLIAEPMARLGAHVTAIDASEKNIKVAKLHAEQSGLNIDYRCITAETLLDEAQGSRLKAQNPKALSLEPKAYDIVLALEVIEHVADVAVFVETAAKLLKPSGLFIVTTLNRTAKSMALAIIGAEYILRWLPRGTHSWSKFLKPSELCAQLRHNDIEVRELTGMVMSPLSGKWRLDKNDLSVNYLVSGTKLLTL